MALRVPESKFWDHFYRPKPPPKPPKRHLRNPNRTSKSDFLPFCVFLIFLPHFLWAFFEHGPYFSNGQNSHFPESKCWTPIFFVTRKTNAIRKWNVLFQKTALKFSHWNVDPPSAPVYKNALCRIQRHWGIWGIFNTIALYHIQNFCIRYGSIFSSKLKIKSLRLTEIDFSHFSSGLLA